MLLGAGLLLFCGCGPQAEKKSESANSADSTKNVVIETIMARHSVRKYKVQPVRVVSSEEYINGISEIYKMADPKVAADPNFKNMFRNAPAVIFVASPKDGSGQLDCGLLSENMVIAAQSLGLGTCCLGGPIRFMNTNTEAAPYLAKLGFSDDYTLLLAIAVGYPDESPEASPRDASKVLFVEK